MYVGAVCAAARHHGVRGAHRVGDRPQDAALLEVLAVWREARLVRVPMLRSHA